MKFNVILLFSLLCLISCSSFEESSTAISVNDTYNKATYPIPVATAKTIISDNLFIDVDLEAHNKAIADNFDPKDPEASLKRIEQLYPEEEQMSRAAWYRYYNKISLVDGLWICSATKASDLNMSERTFKFINDNVTALNEEAKKAREEGISVKMPLLSADFIRSIINE